MKKLITFIIILAIIIGGYYYFKKSGTEDTNSMEQTVNTENPIAEVSYTCNENKTIHAKYYEGEDGVAPDGRPIPGGSVVVNLSDGRQLTLAQTISADGIRYSDGDPSIVGGETFVFWSKGNTALVLENNVEKSYINCVEDSGNGTNVEVDATL